MNPLQGKTEKETRKIIADLRKKIKFNEGLDSCSFIKIIQPNKLLFRIKAKNNCGYKSADIDEDRIVEV